MHSRWQRFALAIAGLAVIAYGWWFTSLAPFSRRATLAWLGAVAVVVGFALVRRRRSARAATTRTGALVWSALAIAVVVWELLALHGSPRSAHPTISSLVESVEQWHAVRLAFYAAWLAVGWVIAA